MKIASLHLEVELSKCADSAPNLWKWLSTANSQRMTPRGASTIAAFNHTQIFGPHFVTFIFSIHNPPTVDLLANLTYSLSDLLSYFSQATYTTRWLPLPQLTLPRRRRRPSPLSVSEWQAS
jgi:hypothetical protein